MRKTKAPLGASLVLLSSLFYASYGIWTKLMGNFFSGYTASALRSIVVVAMLLLIAGILKKFEPLKLRQNGPQFIGMTIAAAFIWGPLYYAILTAGVGLALTVAYASIVISTFFFGKILLGERLTKDKLISVVLGITGLALIFLPTSSGFALLGLAAAALSGLGSGLNTVVVKQVKYNATQSTLVMWVTSVIANTAMAVVLQESLPSITWRPEWLFLIVFAVTSLVATWSLVSGLKYIEAGAAGVLGLMEIVFGLAFGAVFFHERPTGLALLGALIIMVASAIPYIRDYHDQKMKLAKA